MDNKTIFAKNLQNQMDVHKKTRKQVCNDLGFSYYTFSDWVNGKKFPRMDKVEILANYFGILKSDLIEDKSNNFTPIGITSSNQARWDSVFGDIYLTDDEVDKLIQYAKFLISQREEDK